MNAKDIANNIVNEAKATNEARLEKIRAIAKKLDCDFAKAESFVKQEEARKAYGEKYRQSEAYKARLEAQKIVRQMLKG